MNTKDFARIVLLVAASLALGGCATPAVWKEGQFARYHEPASPLDVRLFYSAEAKDVLVDYVEIRDNDAKIHRRAFWLEPNVKLLHERRHPHFVSLKAEPGLTPIPLSPPAATVHPVYSNEVLYALVSTDGRTFTLYSSGKKIGAYDLPVYRDASGRVKQVLLTPLAVTADVTILGGLIYAEAMCHAGGLWLPSDPP
jgi:hypothetical protein